MNHSRLFATLAILGGAIAARAQSLEAFQGLYVGNGGAFTAIDSNGGANDVNSAFNTSASFTGMNGNGDQQTMTVSGSAYSSAGYGNMHVFGQGTVSNSYYNASNSPMYDGNFDPNGSPDLIAIHGNAGWSDTFTYWGTQLSGYKVNYWFQLEGTVSGDIEAGLNFSTSDGSVLPFQPRTTLGNVLWISPDYDVVWGVPFDVNADFYAGMTTYASTKADGSTYSSSADYSNTLTLAGIVITDPNGNVFNDWTLESASGTNYAHGAVPEPTSILALLSGLGLLGVRRRRARAI